MKLTSLLFWSALGVGGYFVIKNIQEKKKEQTLAPKAEVTPPPASAVDASDYTSDEDLSSCMSGTGFDTVNELIKDGLI